MRCSNTSASAIMMWCCKTKRPCSASGMLANFSPVMNACSLPRRSSSSVRSATTRCWCGCSSLFMVVSYVVAVHSSGTRLTRHCKGRCAQRQLCPVTGILVIRSNVLLLYEKDYILNIFLYPKYLQD